MKIKKLKWTQNYIYNRSYASCPIFNEIVIWFDDDDNKFKAFQRFLNYEVTLGSSYKTMKNCQEAIERIRKQIILECINDNL